MKIEGRYVFIKWNNYFNLKYSGVFCDNYFFISYWHPMFIVPCYGLNVYIFPKFIKLKSYPQYDTRMWGLLEIIGIKWGQKDGALTNGSSVPNKSHERVCFLSLLSTLEGYKKKLIICSSEEGPYQKPSRWHPGLRFQPPEPREINFCCL